MRRSLEHDPEKWKPVFGQDHAPSNLEHDPEKHALGLDPMGGNRFSDQIMRRNKI
jgi:hypothetical protein